MAEESKVQTNKTNSWGIIIFVTSVLLLLFLRYCDNYKYDNYQHKGVTIGLVTRYKHQSKSTYIKYYFYKGERIVGSMLVSGSNNNYLNKFYEVKYDLENPTANYIVLEKELKPDSITLVKAGFTKTKYYIYDGGVTCKYIEKLKWK